MVHVNVLFASALDIPYVAAALGAYLGAVCIAGSTYWERDKIGTDFWRDYFWGTVFFIGPVLAIVVGLVVAVLTGDF